ncbi:MAG: TraC family protein [Neisseriaceae bacterium]|nr:TraC family protein [Neisseriaceae bacterium]
MATERDKLFGQFQNRDRAAPFLPIIVGDETNAVFYFEDSTNHKDRAIASCCMFSPLSGIDGKSVSAITTMFNTELPPGTIMQFIQMGNPVLDAQLSRYTNCRNDSVFANLPNIDHSAISAAQYAVHNRADFLRSGSRTRLVPGLHTILTESLCFFTLRVPVKSEAFRGSNADDRKFFAEVDEFVKLRSQLLSQLEVAGISAKIMFHEEVLALYRKYFKIYENWDNYYNPDEILAEQIFPVASSLKWGAGQKHHTIHCKGFTSSGERQNIAMLALDKYPGPGKDFSIYRMLELLGNLSGQGVQFGLPYCLATTIHFPDQEKKRAKFLKSHVITSKQSKSRAMMEWSERLRAKKVGFSEMAKAISDGGNVLEATTTLTFFNPSTNELDKAISRIAAYYESFGFIMRRETYIPEVSFFNNLPMNASIESIKNTHRFKTMMGLHAAHLLPILDEWRGVENIKDGKHLGNEMVLTTRLGRLFNYSLFGSTNGNFNWVMIAGAGSGKSFFTQRLTQDHLSIGTKIWTIDTGSSYLAAARASGAQIIDFDMNSQVCLNPFTKIENLALEIPLLLPIFEKMAKGESGERFTSIESAAMEDAIQSVFRSYRNHATMDEVIDFLNNQAGDDELPKASRKLGTLLTKFGSTGSMGKWFNGENNFEAAADWTVLELSGLTNNKHLCDVVLMLISTTISQEMFVSRNDRKKMLIIEEGGDRVTDPVFAEFIAKLYSKGRKENASVGIVTQTFSQIHATEHGQKIMASAWTQFYMQQSPEDIQTAIDNSWLQVDAYTEQLLRNVHTEKGRFSEVVIRSGQTAGIARLIETPFNRVLFSTEGDFFRELQRRVRNGEQITNLVSEEAYRRYPEEMQWIKQTATKQAV